MGYSRQKRQCSARHKGLPSKLRNLTVDKRLALILGISIVAVIILLLLAPIKQDSNYHLFADNRTIAYVANFFNVVSNLPFVIIGYLGIRLIRSTSLPLMVTGLKSAYWLFFSGVFMTGFGSAYYHLQPDNTTLLWDRLPMTILFMAFFCIVIGECISVVIAKRLLLPLLALGVISVFYWYFTEHQGHGDLRPYILVQFLPVVLIPLILWLYDGNQNGCQYVWAVLGMYVLAKLAESMDSAIYQQLGFISGHSIKHLLAGFGAYWVYARLRNLLKATTKS